MDSITDDRLAQIIDTGTPAKDWEMRIIAAELLARRAGDRQRTDLTKSRTEAMHEAHPKAQ